MSVEQRFLDASLNLYRRTFKRVRPVHVATHWLITHSVIPLLETAKNFKTMPDDPFWFRLELLTNRHEIATTRQIQQLIKPGMTVLDVGAHVGYYTRLCADLVGKNGRVVAFEPHPRNRDYLQRNVPDEVIVLPVAVAESEGSAELYDYLMMSASGSLHYDEALRDVQRQQLRDGDVAPRIARDFPMETFTVRTTRIDDCLAELGIGRVDVMKMDIEGAEMGALRGMPQIIQQSPDLKLVMEFNPMGLQAFGHDPLTVIPEIQAMGFAKVQQINDDGSLTNLNDDAIQQLTDQLMQHMGVVNLLLLRA